MTILPALILASIAPLGAGSVLPARSADIQLVPVADLDRDGERDLVVATSSTGRELLAVSGRTLRALWIFAPRAEYTGRAPTLAPCSDHDGDGTPDIAAGWRRPEDDAAGASVLVAVHSGATGRVLAWSSVAADVKRATIALAEVGDLDGDGHAELALGITSTDFERGVVLALSGVDLAPHELARGEHRWARFGTHLAALGDVDGDGRPDLAVGQPGPGNSGPTESGPEPRGPEHANGSILIVSGRDGRTLCALRGADLARATGCSGIWRFGRTFAAVADADPRAPANLWTFAPAEREDGVEAVLLAPRDGRVLARVPVVDSCSWDGGHATLGRAGDWDGDGTQELLVWNHERNRESASRFEQDVGHVRVIGIRGLIAEIEGESAFDSVGRASAPARTGALWIARRGSGGPDVELRTADGEVLRRFSPGRLAPPEVR